MVPTSPIPSAPGGTASTLAWCRACGRAAGAGPGGVCGACHADLSPPADERHSPVGRTFTHRARMRTHTGLAVEDRGDVMVLLDAGGRTVDVDTSRLGEAPDPDPLAQLTSPAYRLAVAARSRPEQGLLLARSQELLATTAAGRAYAACALNHADVDELGRAGLSALEVAWLRLWHYHRTGSPVGILDQLAVLPTGGYPDKLAVIAAGWGRLTSEPEGRRLVAAHVDGCAAHPLGVLLRAAGDDPEVDWLPGVPVPSATPGLGFEPAATGRLASLLATHPGGDAGGDPGDHPAGHDPAGDALRRATEHLFAWEWEKAQAAAEEALELLDVDRAPAPAGADPWATGAAAEARNVAACAAWQAGDPAWAAHLLAEAERDAPAPARPALLLNRSLVAISAGDRTGAAEALGGVVLAGEAVPVRLDAGRRAVAAWYGGAGSRQAPADPGRPPDAVVSALRTIGASTSRALAAESGRAECFDDLMVRLHHLGQPDATPVAPLAASAPSPWLVLGVPFGTGAAEARIAFTRRARRLRRTDEPAPFTMADLTWALHDIEHRGDEPWHRLDCYRVPLRPPWRRVLRHAALEVITSGLPTRPPDPYADPVTDPQPPTRSSR